MAEETVRTYLGPSEEQLEAESEIPELPETLARAVQGEEIEVSLHPLDQGGDSARVYLEEHPEEIEENRQLAEQLGLLTPEVDEEPTDTEE